MELEEGDGPGVAPPGPPPGAPPPPPPPATGRRRADFGPARPPLNADHASAYADPAAYEAYVQSNVAYQVCADVGSPAFCGPRYCCPDAATRLACAACSKHCGQRNSGMVEQW